MNKATSEVGKPDRPSSGNLGGGSPLPHPLSTHRFVYEALVDRLLCQSREDPESTAAMVERVSTFAWRHHSGVFADGRVENILLELDDEVERRVSTSAPGNCFARDGRPRQLHVASRANQTTGNTRVLAKWIERDEASDHCLILTHDDGPVPPVLEDACRRRSTRIIRLPSSLPRLERAALLRSYARQSERIILHHDREDAVPILALASADCPPVVYFNHSHFWFSLGDTVADLTLNTMPFFLRLTERCRFPRRTALIPGVTGNHDYESFDKAESKEKLGLDPRLPVLLSSGFEGYYRPARGVDFFATLRKVLNRCGPVQVLVAGVRPEADFVPADMAARPDVRLCGPVPDLRPYYHAADLCLESFPHPSLGAFLEASAYGAAFPIPAYGEGESVLRVDLPPLCDYSPRARDEASYIASVVKSLHDLERSRRVAGQLQADLQALDQAWPATLQSIYAQVDGLSHSPRPVQAAGSTPEPDSRLLAELSRANPAELIHAWFPYLSALRLNLLSVRMGLATPKQALGYELHHLWQAMAKRLPWQPLT